SWGGREKWESIPDWNEMDLSRPSDKNPGVRKNPDSQNPDEFIEYKCDVCGHKYLMKVRTRVAGHGCPVCLKSRVKSPSQFF
ncbi:MAG: zinc-ribbon domain-containing protein, partial [Muribaculaceae bacterium]|nr:zinc-ribbon domain-containing protein [Muribaculaceae bacterium]